MDKTPKISIVLPTYNGTRFLHESIASCLDQSCKDIELIIVDDCSTEDVSRITGRFNDERMRLIRNESNLGLPGALNEGFRVAAGDYLTWTSDDNYYAQGAIEAMRDRLDENPAIDFVYCNYTFIDNDGRLGESIRTGVPGELDSSNCIGPCFLYRRRVYEVVGDYDRNCSLAEDYDYWLRVRKRFSMEKIDEDLYFFRLHGSSLTERYRDTDYLRRQVEMVRKKNMSIATYYFLRSRESFSLGNNRESFKFAFLSALFNPFNSHVWAIMVRALYRKLRKMLAGPL
ncbi:MAG: glycosyltransferase [Syntrophorhabdaceae bacterium]|nr:glycosyltransferase [Syntrophorhabdaceae bacterium]MDD5243121.1 glycosyltransferase [Syntrophorhabdaceae bacterium]